VNRTDNQNSDGSVVSSELLRKVKLLEIKTRLQVRDVFGGQYHSIFKGQGMDFDEVREYTPGDDFRNIDWNVSARMNHPYIKVYREERELTVLILVDVSASGDFGSVNTLKREIAAELTALLALCALTNNDKVGLLLFSDQIEHFVAPKKGRRHVLRLIRDVLTFTPKSPKTSINSALEYSLKLLKRKSVLFLLSDFNDNGYEKVIRIAARKHDLIALELYDPREREIPAIGLVPFHDPESGEVHWMDSSSKKFREAFGRTADLQARKREDFFKSVQIDRIALSVDKPYDRPLIKFFRTRERRR